MDGFSRFPGIPLFQKSEPGPQGLAPHVRIQAQISDSGLGPGGPPYPYLPLRFTEMMEFLKIGSAISTRNGRIYEISRNSTFPEIPARASGSGPTHQNLSPDLDQEIRGNRLGYIHSGLEEFPDFQKLQFPGNPRPGFRSPDHFWDRFRIIFGSLLVLFSSHSSPLPSFLQLLSPQPGGLREAGQ